MTKAEKRRKLCNAIRKYRGAYHPESKKWIRAPQPLLASMVRLWLARNRINVVEGMERIDNFSTATEFHNWINSLDDPAKPEIA